MAIFEVPSREDQEWLGKQYPMSGLMIFRKGKPDEQWVQWWGEVGETGSDCYMVKSGDGYLMPVIGIGGIFDWVRQTYPGLLPPKRR